MMIPLRCPVSALALILCGVQANAKTFLATGSGRGRRHGDPEKLDDYQMLLENISKNEYPHRDLSTALLRISCGDQSL